MKNLNFRKVRMKNNNFGITLIALVVTVIVLLILAGISISMLSGDNSILQKATDTKTVSDESAIQEKVQLAYLAALAQGNGEVTKDNLITELNKSFYNYKFSNDLKKVIIDNKEYDIGGTVTKTVSKPTDIFVVLYNDGTLIFSNNMNDIDTSKIQTNYGNIKDSDYAFSDMYNSDITKINVINEIVPTTCSNWFNGLYCVTEILNLDNLDISNVTDTSYMFYACESLNEVDVSGFDTSNIINMEGMFGSWDDFGAVGNITGLENFDTSKVTNMRRMFRQYRGNELNLSSFDTSNVTDMSEMFCWVYDIDRLDLSNFDTNNVSNYIDMFTGWWDDINAGRYRKIIVGPNWNPDMTETATGYRSIFEKTN